MKPSFLYRFLKVYCSIGLWFYYRSWQVAGREKVPATGPLIYIANHQNAFIDAILLTCSASRNPYYLARANVFQKPWAAKLLAAIRLKPIYRFRDGFSTLKNNDVVMQNCVDLMKQGEIILLFPEGNHNEPWSMGEYQKGFARMAAMYVQQTQDTSLRLVPVGIHYTEHYGFNQRVLINFGDAISIGDVLSPQATERENLEALVNTGEAAIKKLALDIKPEAEYTDRRDYLVRNRRAHSDMLQQLHSDREVLARYPEEQSVDNRISILRTGIASLFMVYVSVTHGILYLWIRNLIQKKIKDPQFKSSIKYALGIFITPVHYFLLTVIFYILTQDGLWSLLFLLSLPTSLMLATKLRKV